MLLFVAGLRLVLAGQVPLVTQYKQVRCIKHLKECYGPNYVFPVGCMKKIVEEGSNADVVIFVVFWFEF
jgi:hypothetical protein